MRKDSTYSSHRPVVRRAILTRVAAVALVFSLGFVAVPTSAIAAPTAKQIRAVKDQVEALDAQMEIASDDYQTAASKYATATKKRQKAEARLKTTTSRMKVLRNNLGDRAVSMYRSGPTGFIDVLFGVQSFEDFATVWEILADMNEQDAANLDELTKLKAEIEQLNKTLVAQEKSAKAAAATMKAKKDSIQKKLAERQRKLAGMESQVAALQASEEHTRSNSHTYNWPDPVNAPRSGVVGIAKQYIGVPYRWAGSSPSTGFDCSGFTMYVYRQVGVRLPHSSRAQIGVGERISRANLEPGDLVFFGSPIHHVGMYVGGGRYIHAPHTGSSVRIDSMNRSDYAGACRP